MNRHTDVQRETIIPHHLVAGYKNDHFSLQSIHLCLDTILLGSTFKSSYIRNCLITNHLIKQFQHTVQHQRIWSDGANIHADLGLHWRHAFQRHKAWLICSVVCDKILFLQQKDFSCTLFFWQLISTNKNIIKNLKTDEILLLFLKKWEHKAWMFMWIVC